MRTLVVSFLPRGDSSNTKRLLDAFLDAASGREIDLLDLTREIPDLFNTATVDAYLRRHYMGETLPAETAALLSGMNRMADRILAADAVVLATPMHNFSLPAIVKGWFDAVLLKGRTWDSDETGLKGYMAGKKALVLMTSGGTYPDKPGSWDHAMPLAKIEFRFMGITDVRGVAAGGSNALSPEEYEKEIARATAEIQKIAQEWYHGPECGGSGQ